MGAREITVLMPNPGVRVAGDAAGAEDDAAVLHRSLRIPKARADHPDFRPHGVAHHFAQPRCVHHFDVVVEKQN